MAFSYFTYAAAFALPEDDPGTIDGGLVAIGLVLAPVVFVVLAFVSRNPAAPKRVLQAMGLLLVLGLAVGLLSPVLGAAAGFGVGGALTLRPPDVADVAKWRLWSVAFMVAYVLFLLAVATPAGVFSGGLLPLLMLGFADEYSAWREAQRRAA
jgi:hypothetical protein